MVLAVDSREEETFADGEARLRSPLRIQQREALSVRK